MSDILRADNEQLMAVSKQLMDEMSKWEGIAKAVKTHVDELRSGAWIGPGADAFYVEMDNVMFPACAKMMSAFGDTADILKRISNILSEAEEEARKFTFFARGGGMG